MIQNTEAAGRDASELKEALESIPAPGQSRKTDGRRGEEEEETTEERLIRRVGYLFPNGIPFKEIYDLDCHYSQKDLIQQCRDAGLSLSGDKKELAAKLLANGSLRKEEAQMAQIDLKQQREWSGKPGTLTIPEEYIKGLKFEVIVFARKERGGSDFSFQCKYFEREAGHQYKFGHVLIDTSRKNPQGEVIEARLTYHPEVWLANVGFMVVPVAED